MRYSRPIWVLVWRSENSLDGKCRYIMAAEGLFDTRAKARKHADENYGYIRERPDLRKEPHGWRMPLPVRAILSIEVR